jgi:endonuclease/exonuclease/phosphatase family metal-dependent hydrolase
LHNLASDIAVVKHIKIITINTWKCDGNYHARMGVLAEQLAALKPTIVACQECFYSDEGKADTLHFLAGKLNMNYSFLRGRVKKRFFEDKWVESFSGLGILSAYPITTAIQLELPGMPEDNDRKAQQAVINLPGGEQILFTNTHFTHTGNKNGLRTSQAEALAGFVTKNVYCKYHIICGDFNAIQSSVEIETFMLMSGAIDCYKAGNGPEPAYSLVAPYTENKLICVDHIFALPMPGDGKYPEFINSGVILNIPDKLTGLYPSDHFGISTTLIIN